MKINIPFLKNRDKEKQKKKKIPDNIHMRLTLRCNLQCSMCDIWKENNSSELDVRQWKHIIKEIYNWVGPYRVDFAGGEIFIYEGFLDLIKYCKKLGCHPVVTTNGILLNERKVKKIIESGLDTINISLDTLNRVKYKDLKNSDNFDKVIKAFEFFNEYRERRFHPFLCMATIMMEQNSDELVDLIYWVKEGNADIINFQVIDNNFGKKYDSFWYKNSPFWPHDTENIVKKIDKIIELKEKDFPINNSIQQLSLFKEYFRNTEDFIKSAICRSGERNFIIDTNGDILLCWNMQPVGNIFHHPPEEIWSSKMSSDLREKISKCVRTCKVLNCNFQ